MARDVDYLVSEELAKFVPTDRQLAVKILVKSKVPESIVEKLLPETLIALAPYVTPYKASDLILWQGENPVFFEWLLAPDNAEVALEGYRNKALGVLEEILCADVSDEGLNSRVMAVKLKAAEFILSRDSAPKGPKQVTQKLSLYGARVPKHLASKPVEALEAEIKELERA